MEPGFEKVMPHINISISNTEEVNEWFDEPIDAPQLSSTSTLNSRITRGHTNSREATLILIMWIYMGHIYCFSRNLMWVNILCYATYVL